MSQRVSSLKTVPPARQRRGLLLSLLLLVVVALGVRLWHDRHAPYIPPADLAEAAHRAQERPDDTQAQIDWGDALVKAGRLDEAAQVFAHAAQRAPQDARPYVGLGMIAVKRRLTPQAKSYFTQALRLSPTDADVWRALAELQQRDHQTHEAIASYTQVTQLHPDDVFAWKQLGVLNNELNLMARAQAALRQAAKLDPTDMQTQERLGTLDASLGQLPEAKQEFTQVLAHDPNNVVALAGLAGVTLQLDPSPTGLAQAQQQVDQALVLHPTGRAHLTRGRIYLLRKDYPHAISEFKTALSLDHSLTYANTYLSQAYAAQGQKELARKAAADFQKAQAQTTSDNGSRSPE